MLNQNQSWNLSLEGVWNSTTVNRITENHTFNQVDEILASNSNPLTHDRKGNLTQSKDGSQNLIREYVFGGLYVDEVIFVNNGTYHYYLTDLRYNVYALIDSNGNVVERARYDGYGKRTLLSPSYTVIGTPNVDQSYGYTGRRHDSESGLQYFRARYFDNDQGRFINRDPLGYIDGLNLYRGYFIVGGLDPSGTDFIALADRSVTGTVWIQNHYSIQYWSCKCNAVFTSEMYHTDGYTTEKILEKCPSGCSKKESIELLRDATWKVWGSRPSFWDSNKYVWDIHSSIWISYIRNTDSQDTDIMPIYLASEADVEAKWNLIKAFGVTYEYAEQGGFAGGTNSTTGVVTPTTFTKWPKSLYKAFGTNSNTFVRAAIDHAGITWHEMDGNHRGSDIVPPSQNTDDAPYGGPWIFSAHHTPWKTWPDKPKPTGRP